MKLLERICRQPVAVAFDLRRGGGGQGGSGDLALSVTRAADSVSLVTAAGATSLRAATPSVAGVLQASDKAKLDTLTNALATPASDGLMSGTDKSKLDGLGSGQPGAGGMSAATYDPQGVAKDAFDRANHGGQQPISTVGGLQTALDGKAGQAHAHSALEITSGKLKHERGGLQADVSAYDGLVKISGGSTSQAVAGQDYATPAQGTLADSALQPGNTVTALDGTAHRLLHVDAAGNVAELGYGTPGTFLKSEGPSTPPTWGTPAISGSGSGSGAGSGSGSGDVSKVGVPVANRMAYWAGDGTLGHEAGFTYDPDSDTLTVSKVVVGGITFDGTGQLTDPNADRVLGWDDSAGKTAFFAPTDGLEIGGTDLRMTANQRTSAVEFVIDGGGSAIAGGIKGFIQVPMDCTITAARLLGDRPGSVVVDIWKDSFANYPPTGAKSITGATPPTIAAAIKSEDVALTGWTTGIAAGDMLGFNVDSASAISRVTVVLVVTVS